MDERSMLDNCPEPLWVKIVNGKGFRAHNMNNCDIFEVNEKKITFHYMNFTSTYDCDILEEAKEKSDLIWERLDRKGK